MSGHFTEIFVYLLVIFSKFNDFKLITWDPANNYLFKVSNRNTRKWCVLLSKLTIKIVERGSGVLIVNLLSIFHIFF